MTIAADHKYVILVDSIGLAVPIIGPWSSIRCHVYESVMDIFRIEDLGLWS